MSPFLLFFVLVAHAAHPSVCLDRRPALEIAAERVEAPPVELMRSASCGASPRASAEYGEALLQEAERVRKERSACQRARRPRG